MSIHRGLIDGGIDAACTVVTFIHNIQVQLAGSFVAVAREKRWILQVAQLWCSNEVGAR